MKVIFHPEASEEMMESARFCEERTAGLGLDFLDAVQQTTERIHAFPDAGQFESANIRRRFVPGFPFKILYQHREDHVFVGAVMHQLRRPGYWRPRM